MGEDWYNDPEVLPNLATFVNANLGTQFPTDQAVVKASEVRLFDFPLSTSPAMAISALQIKR